MADLAAEIKLYLTDETVLYLRWEALLYESEKGRQLVGSKSTLAELKAKAQVWLQKFYTQHRDHLRQVCHEQRVGEQTICERWQEFRVNYQAVEYGLLTDLIIQFSNTLEKKPELHSVVGLATVMAVMMITHNILDELCNEST